MVEEYFHALDFRLRSVRIIYELEVSMYTPCADSGFKFQSPGL